jgi:hypothetical protein
VRGPQITDSRPADVIEQAFDYRGDVIATRDGAHRVGYLFNRRRTSQFLRQILPRQWRSQTITYAEIRALR